MAHSDRTNSATQPDLKTPVPFDAIARLPVDGDNVAIAARRLEAGLSVEHDGAAVQARYTILVGHRFAVEPIAQDDPLLSWGLPFGVAHAPDRAGRVRMQRRHDRSAQRTRPGFHHSAAAEFPGPDRRLRSRRDELPSRTTGGTIHPGTHIYGVPPRRRARCRHAQHDHNLGGQPPAPPAFARSLAQALQPAAGASPTSLTSTASSPSPTPRAAAMNGSTIVTLCYAPWPA